MTEQPPTNPAKPASPQWWCRHRRPPYRRPTGARRVFIPIYGWIDVDDDHRSRVEQFFHVPMLVLALSVLPLLVIEWYYAERMDAVHPAIQIAIYAGGGLIWTAFLIELIIKVWIARSRWGYVTRNWLDIVIVALPMLRPLRGFRVVRAAQVARMSRVFTLRGVVMKLIRTTAATIVGLGFIQRLAARFRGFVGEDASLDYRKWSRACLIAEIERLNNRVQKLENRLHEPRTGEAERPPKSTRRGEMKDEG